MGFLTFIYWLAGAGALALFAYLGYALLQPERF
ncbi:K(+)-transporting ATPase subunit F [Comamonas sp. NLF-1-9]|nr:K(+)-transporting ATPase subunit F [Comamonas sp. NLF-1-9]QXL83821.1 K(+)-transporting ATPase subunit F [Comamonas sp. NLF-1-9]